MSEHRKPTLLLLFPHTSKQIWGWLGRNEGRKSFSITTLFKPLKNEQAGGGWPVNKQTGRQANRQKRKREEGKRRMKWDRSIVQKKVDAKMEGKTSLDEWRRKGSFCFNGMRFGERALFACSYHCT